MLLEPHIKRRLTRIAIGCVIGLAVAYGVVRYDMGKDETRRAEMRDYALNTPAPEIGGAFALTNQSGQTVTEQNLLGKFALITFGFTFCPDVCPSRIQDMVLAMDVLGADSTKVQPIFVTIDPARDTVAQLKSYVGLYSAPLWGLTGTAAQVDQIAKAYKVYYARSEAGDDDEAEKLADRTDHADSAVGGGDDDYMMDHTTLIYLMGPDGKFVTTFKENTDPAEIATAIRQKIQP
jgi:protein SCO1